MKSPSLPPGAFDGSALQRLRRATALGVGPATRRWAGLVAAGAGAGLLAAALSEWLAPWGAAALAAVVAGVGLARATLLRTWRAALPPAAPADASRSRRADIDPLTGLATQERFLEMFDREWARSRRYGVGAALAVIELDDLPARDVQAPADARDAALAALAREVQASLRAADFAGRHGPRSLRVFLAHADAIGAVDALERLRDHLERLPIRVAGRAQGFTVSAGVALLRPSHLDAYALLADAEAALRAAQAEGGNCVRAAPGSLSPGARAARSR